jgi:hypothetical protein
VVAPLILVLSMLDEQATIVYCCLVVVDVTARHTAQGRERSRVGIEQHLMAPAGIGDQPERTAGA